MTTHGYMLWECEVLRDPTAAVQRVLRVIRPAGGPIDYGSLPDRRTVLQAAVDAPAVEPAESAGEVNLRFCLHLVINVMRSP